MFALLFGGRKLFQHFELTCSFLLYLDGSGERMKSAGLYHLRPLLGDITKSLDCLLSKVMSNGNLHCWHMVRVGAEVAAGEVLVHRLTCWAMDSLCVGRGVPVEGSRGEAPTWGI